MRAKLLGKLLRNSSRNKIQFIEEDNYTAAVVVVVVVACIGRIVAVDNGRNIPFAPVWEVGQPVAVVRLLASSSLPHN